MGVKTSRLFLELTQQKPCQKHLENLDFFVYFQIFGPDSEGHNFASDGGNYAVVNVLVRKFFLLYFCFQKKNLHTK